MGNSVKLRRMSKASSGYLILSQVAARLLNILFAGFFLTLSFPVLVILFPAVAIFNGRPILYADIRYGKNKKPFTMYKFRTLPIGFETQKEGLLFSYNDHAQLHWFNRFLRDSRLDELPQLVNVLMGDMAFLGPRPERPAVYRRMCRMIRDYDERFKVEPGLIGYSQLFTPHSTPKRIRSFIDNRSSRYRKNVLQIGYLTLITVYAVLKRGGKLLATFFVKGVLKTWIGKQYSEKRLLDRVRINGGRAFLCKDNDRVKECMIAHADKPFGTLVDMNEEFCRIDSGAKLDENNPMVIRLVTDRSSAICWGRILRGLAVMNPEAGYTYILKYEPVSDLNGYFIDQHFLEKSLMKYLL